MTRQARAKIAGERRNVRGGRMRGDAAALLRRLAYPEVRTRERSGAAGCSSGPERIIRDRGRDRISKARGG